MKQLIYLFVFWFCFSTTTKAHEKLPKYSDARIDFILELIENQEVKFVLVHLAPNEYWEVEVTKIENDTLHGIWYTPSDVAATQAHCEIYNRWLNLCPINTTPLPYIVVVDDLQLLDNKRISIPLKAFKDVYEVPVYRNTYDPKKLFYLSIILSMSTTAIFLL
jgi:hypothetical protein